MNVLVQSGKTIDLGRITNYLEKTIFYLKNGSYTMPFSVINDNLDKISNLLISRGPVQPKEEIQPKKEEAKPQSENIGDFSFPIYQENGDSDAPHVVQHQGGVGSRHGRKIDWTSMPGYDSAMAEFVI